MGLFVHRLRRFSSAAAIIAALGLVLPAEAFAADAIPAAAAATASQPTPALDVSLAEGGVLTGQVVDAQGLPLAGTEVTLRTVKGQAISGSTDSEGRFEVRGLGGGLYEVTAAQKSGAFRLWVGNAGPPGAVKQVLLVAGQTVTRGQYLGRGQWFGGTGSLLGGVIILGSLGGIVAGGIITGLQSPPSS